MHCDARVCEQHGGLGRSMGFSTYFQLRRVWTLWKMFHFSMLTSDWTSYHSLTDYKYIHQDGSFCGQWWYMPVIPAFGREMQVDFWLWGQPGLKERVPGQPGLYRDTLSQKKKDCIFWFLLYNKTAIDRSLQLDGVRWIPCSKRSLVHQAVSKVLVGHAPEGSVDESPDLSSRDLLFAGFHEVEMVFLTGLKASWDPLPSSLAIHTWLLASAGQ